MESLTPAVVNPVRQPLFTAAAVGSALGLALVGESVRSMVETRHLSTEAPYHTNDNDMDINLFVLGGCRNHAGAMERVMEPSYGQIANTAYISYPPNGNIVEGVTTAWRRAVAELPPAQHTVILARSMGALVLGEALKDDTFKQEVGQIDTLMLDSSPPSLATVRKGVKLSLFMAGLPLLRSSSTYNDITSWGVRHATSKFITRRGPNTSEEDARLLHDAAASVHNTSIYRQGLLIKTGDFSTLAGLTRRNCYITAPHDPIVDTMTAVRDFRSVLPNIELLIDTERPEHSHAATTEYSSLPRQIMAGASIAHA